METNKQPGINNARDGAVFWVVRLHTCEDLEAHLPEFSQWVGTHPDNYPAYLAFRRTWLDLVELNDHGVLDLVRAQIESQQWAGGLRAPFQEFGRASEVTQAKGTILDGGDDVFEPMLPIASPGEVVLVGNIRDTRGQLSNGFLDPAPQAERRWVTSLVVATCSLIVVGVAVTGYRMAHPVVATALCDTCGLATGQEASDYGHIRSLSLVDGSEITLDANSQVTLDVTDDHRKVHLDRGEALFRVNKERSVPFEVHVGSTTLTAVGTVFSVEKTGPDWSQTVVEEGEILVSTNPRTSYQVKARQAAEVKDGEFHLRAASQSNVDARLAWTSGLLSLDGEPLKEAALRMNRYNRQKIEVDAALANRPVWGLFSAHDPGAFAAALDQMLDIRHSITKDPVSGVETIHLIPKK